MADGSVREEVLTALESTSTLLEAAQVRERIEALDWLDSLFGEMAGADRLAQRVEDLRERLEAENARLYRSLRREIERGRAREALLPLISSESEPVAGLSYDWRDELVSGVLSMEEPDGVDEVGEEMVFYQPTPVRHLMAMIAASGLSEKDVLVDLGSGMGHVPMLASMLSGARCVGVELDGAYVARAREGAVALGLDRVEFVEGDARGADYSEGTVFYLYTPFTGSVLREVLEKLRAEGERRAIRVCTLGPCAEVVAGERWLEACGVVEAGRVVVFASR